MLMTNRNAGLRIWRCARRRRVPQRPGAERAGGPCIGALRYAVQRVAVGPVGATETFEPQARNDLSVHLLGVSLLSVPDQRSVQSLSNFMHIRTSLCRVSGCLRCVSEHCRVRRADWQRNDITAVACRWPTALQSRLGLRQRGAPHRYDSVHAAVGCCVAACVCPNQWCSLAIQKQHESCQEQLV